MVKKLGGLRFLIDSNILPSNFFFGVKPNMLPMSVGGVNKYLPFLN